MMNREEIANLTGITEKQRNILLCFYNYDQGYITESELEYDLTNIIKDKSTDTSQWITFTMDQLWDLLYEDIPENEKKNHIKPTFPTRR